MFDETPTCVVRLTPPGRGAVASILVEGPGAVDLVQSLVHSKSGRRLAELSKDRLAVRHFNGENGEEVVVRRRGPSAVELHCHGGYAAAAMIEETLRQRGCRIVDWRQSAVEWQTNPIAAAAVAALADASTLRTASVLLDQYHGALRSALEAMDRAIELKDFAAAKRQADALLANSRLGMHLTEPWRVVIAGPPNAGKSSLINAMLGFQRSIVHHAPGTTRDAVTAVTAMHGWPVQLCDTAGLRSEAEGIEKAGVELAWQRIKDADLTILVFDLAAPWSAADRALVEKMPNAVLVYNKADLAGLLHDSQADRPQGLLTSALTGLGIDELIARIPDRLVPNPPQSGAAVPFTLEQIERIRSSAKNLERFF